MAFSRMPLISLWGLCLAMLRWTYSCLYWMQFAYFRTLYIYFQTVFLELGSVAICNKTAMVQGVKHFTKRRYKLSHSKET